MTMTGSHVSGPSKTVAVEQPTRPENVATITVAILTVVTAVSMCRLFPDWTFLRPMLVIVIGTHVGCWVLRVLRVPAWAALPLGLILLFELVAITFYPETLRLFLPSSDTIVQLRGDLRLVLEQFPMAVAPVPSQGNFAMAASALLGLCAWIADAFGFRAVGRAEVVVPSGLVFIFTSALGTDRNRVVMACLWLGAAVLAIATLRQTHHRSDAPWMGRRRQGLSLALPASLLCAGLAAIGAGVVGPRLPGAGERALIDTHNRGGDVTQVLSPLVDIRSKLVNLSNVQVFTVNATTGHYWQLIGLVEFDGNTWEPSSQTLRPALGQLIRPTGTSGVVNQQLRIDKLGGNLLPAAYAPLVIGTDGVSWADENDALIVKLSRGQVFDLTSSPVSPTPEELRSSGVAGAPDDGAYDLPPGLPDEAIRLAQQVTASGATPYDKAILLQEWFRTQFSYDLTVQRGHDDDAMRNFLRIKRGYCEQFSGTFAAMGRVLGLPTRVAIGYTQGDLEADGLYHVYGRHAHAWPQVWFDGYGWISFEPTPGRGSPDAASYTGILPSQDISGGTAGGSNNGPATRETVPPSTNPRTSVDQRTNQVPTTIAGQRSASTRTSRSGNASATGPLLILTAAALAATWVALMPRLVKAARRRRIRAAHDRVVDTWRRACVSMRRAGAPPIGGATPLQYSVTVERETGLDARMVAELARHVTRAVYSTQDIDDATARRCEQLHVDLVDYCRSRMTWWQRLISRFDPKLAAGT